MPKRKYVTYEVVNWFDVWCNEDEGWQVNNQCREGYIKLQSDYTQTDLVKALQGIDMLIKDDPKNLLQCIQIEDQGELVEVSQTVGDSKLKPLLEQFGPMPLFGLFLVR